jgi:putative addiction module component (TIGR02574 family)
MVSSNQQSVFEAALGLPLDLRAELAERLWESLGDESQEGIAAAWAAELQRRLKAVEDGTATLLDGQSVIAELRKKYGVADK